VYVEHNTYNIVETIIHLKGSYTNSFRQHVTRITTWGHGTTTCISKLFDR